MRHLQASTTLSEGQPTFSYYAKQKRPCESLSNGLSMLVNLVMQLGHSAYDDDIGDKVLNELIQ
jgi:hypothetical protein